MPSKERDYRSEYDNYHSKPEARADRALRNKARRAAEKAGTVRKGDGMDIDHKKPLIKGGTNADGNLRAIPASKNRSFARTKSARMK